MKFDIRQTNIAKGIAVLLLLWHHLFIGNNAYVSLFRIGNVAAEQWFAVFAKCCVAMFMFLSGYGLYISFALYEKTHSLQSSFKTDILFIKQRVIKLLTQYWVVYIIFVPLGILFGRKFYEVYGTNPFHYLVDMFGLSYLFYKHEFTMNATWWYVSEILVFYGLYPLIYRLYAKIRWWILLPGVVLCLMHGVFRGLNIYLYVLMLGTVFAAENWFEKCDKRLNTKWKRLLPILLIVAFGAFRYYLKSIRLVYAMKFDGVFILPILLISYLVISEIPYLNRLLEELGKKSGLIYFFHAFICGYYFKEYLFSIRYSVLIFVVMVAFSYLLAWMLEQLMRTVKYDQLMKRITV